MINSYSPSFYSLILCCYINESSDIQIGRIANIPYWYFERAIFPGQRIIFEAPSEGKLEIHTGIHITAIFSETIDCDCLKMDAIALDFSEENQNRLKTRTTNSN